MKMGRAPEVSSGTKILSSWGNAVRTDYVSQTDPSTQDMASSLDYAANKRVKLDFLYFNPSSAPANTEGHCYYDSTAKKLKLRNDSEWLTIPAATGGGGSAAKGAYDYLIYKSGADYYAEDNEGNVVYGGPDDAGGKDGAKFDLVLNACINALTTGGLIFIASGTYSMGAGQQVTDQSKSNITIQGAGKYSTKIDCTAAITPIKLTNVSKWTVRDLEIDGNDHELTSHVGIELNAVTDSLFQDLYIHHFAYPTGGNSAYGMYVYNCQRVDIVRPRVEECDHSGIQVSYDCADVNIYDGYGANNANGDAGSKSGHFNIYGTSGHENLRCNIINCSGTAAGNYGAQIYRHNKDCWIIGGHYNEIGSGGTALVCVTTDSGGGTDTCENCGCIGATLRHSDNTVGKGIECFGKGVVLANNQISTVKQGIYLAGSGSCVVSGNKVRDTYTHAIVMKGASDWNCITGNVIKNFGSLGYGILLEDGAVYNNITGNVIHTGKFGITLASGADNNDILGNSIYADNQTIQDLGTGNGKNHNREVTY